MTSPSLIASGPLVFVCPPEWDMTPREYRALCSGSRPTPKWNFRARRMHAEKARKLSRYRVQDITLMFRLPGPVSRVIAAIADAKPESLILDPETVHDESAPQGPLSRVERLEIAHSVAETLSKVWMTEEMSEAKKVRRLMSDAAPAMGLLLLAGTATLEQIRSSGYDDDSLAGSLRRLAGAMKDSTFGFDERVLLLWRRGGPSNRAALLSVKTPDPDIGQDGDRQPRSKSSNQMTKREVVAMKRAYREGALIDKEMNRSPNLWVHEQKHPPASTPKTEPKTEPTDQPEQHSAAASTTASGGVPATLPARWEHSVQTHDRISDEWGAILCDPLNALTHSALLSNEQAHTVRFVEAFGQAQDLRSIYGTTLPDLASLGSTRAHWEDVVLKYVGAVRVAETAWNEAVRYAEHVAFAWMTDTDEQKAARQATQALTLANDVRAPMGERINAARRAVALLEKVHSFMLPVQAREVAAAQARGELVSSST